MKARLLLAFVVIGALVAVLPAAAGGGGEAASGSARMEAVNKTGFPIVNQKITLNMMGSRAANQADWNEFEFFQYYEQKTNIHVNWTTVPDASREEKKQLLFASGDLPDALYGMYLSQQEEIQYGNDGTLLPLEGLYSQWAPNITKYLDSDPAIRKTYTTPSGHIYTFPSGTDRTVFLNAYTMINTKWLKTLGLQMPGTIAAYYDVLKAFKTKDPNGNGKADEIPLALLDNKQGNDLWELGQWFGVPCVQASKVFVDDNAKVVYVPIDARFKAELDWFHRAWVDGLLDPEMFTQDYTKIDAKGQDKAAELLGGFKRATIAWTVGFDRTPDYEILPALANAQGKKMVTGAVVNSKGRFSITNRNQHPAATVRWIDYFASVQGAMDIQFGPEGKYWHWNADGKTWELNANPPQSTSEHVTPKNGTYVPFINFNRIVTSRKLAEGQVDWQAKVYAGIDAGLNPYRRVPFPDAYMTLDQVKGIAAIQADANTYVEQMVAKFVVGDAPLSQWDSYVATLQKMGIDKLLGIYQQVYDAYNK